MTHDHLYWTCFKSLTGKINCLTGDVLHLLAGQESNITAVNLFSRLQQRPQWLSFSNKPLQPYWFYYSLSLQMTIVFLAVMIFNLWNKRLGFLNSTFGPDVDVSTGVSCDGVSILSKCHTQHILWLFMFLERESFTLVTQLTNIFFR